MSIRQVQIKNVLEYITKMHFVDGHQPTTSDIYKYVNRFFSEQNAGLPFRLPKDSFVMKSISDPEIFNLFMAMMITNIESLYETSFNQIDQIMTLNTLLSNHLARLKIKRSILDSKIDDYLIGLYNSDGYFYSFSDQFYSTNFTDLSKTSAFIDTDSGNAMIPSLKSASKVVYPDSVGVPSIRVTSANDKTLSPDMKAPFDNAVDGLSNTAWWFEVRTNEPAPVTAEIEMVISTAFSDNMISKVDINPFGSEPVRVALVGSYLSQERATETMPFSNQIKTSVDKMSFVANEVKPFLSSLKIQMSKARPDYHINTSQERIGVYIFGIRELLISEQVYDNFARFVSNPISIPPDIESEAVIDAVSLVVGDHTPEGTSIEYYVAADDGITLDVNDFNWERIEPLSNFIESNQVVRFNGSQTVNRVVRLEPRNPGDDKMMRLDNTIVDLSKRNPTPSYFPGIDVYRITSFDDNVLSNTLMLEEGFNSTRIHYTDLVQASVGEGFDFWRARLDNPSLYSTTYGEIDIGNGFLYGADVGENAKSVYSETNLYVDKELPTLMKECRKSDPNSKTWNVRMFLNGREIATLPPGIDKVDVPWKFKQGRNHIVVMANIPAASLTNVAPYLGSFDIMTDANLYDYGTVKLDDWVYIDPYKFENNQVEESKSFTIYNNEIVSRRKPTNNFKIQYKRATAMSPSAIRVRADLSRSLTKNHLTPLLDSYRVRFSYS